MVKYMRSFQPAALWRASPYVSHNTDHTPHSHVATLDTTVLRRGWLARKKAVSLDEAAEILMLKLMGSIML